MDLISERVVTRLAAGAAGAVGCGLVTVLLPPSSRARGWITAAVVPVGLVVGFRLTSIETPEVTDWTLLPVAAALVVGASITLVTTAGVLDRRVSLLLMVLSVGGIWVGPPENDHTLLLLGAFLGALSIVLIRPGRPAALAFVLESGLVAWAALGGGVGQVHPTLGGLLCFGVLPFGVVALGFRRTTLGAPMVGGLIVGQTVVVIVASRLYAAGAANSVGLMVTLATLTVVLFGLVILGRCGPAPLSPS